jgi:hypothetical protein
LVSVFRTGGFVFPGQEDGEPKVGSETGEETNPGDPDARPVEGLVKELRVVIESLGTRVDQKVPGEMTGEEEDKGKTGNSDDDLATDG